MLNLCQTYCKLRSTPNIPCIRIFMTYCIQTSMRNQKRTSERASGRQPQRSRFLSTLGRGLRRNNLTLSGVAFEMPASNGASMPREFFDEDDGSIRADRLSVTYDDDWLDSR